MNKKQILFTLLIVAVIALFAVFSNSIPGITTNRETVQQELHSAAGRVQALWARPALMDGAGKDFSVFEEAELLSRLNIPAGTSFQPGTDNLLVNKNGTYTVQIHDQNSISITGSPAGKSDDIVLTLSRNSENNGWTLFLDGELQEPQEPAE